MSPDLFEYLYSFISDHKKQRFEQVLDLRTNHLTVVLENVYKPHNASAVLRSCDCFGIQHLHIIEDSKKYRTNPDIERGASQWVNVERYHQAQPCLERLREQGYRLVATSPHINGKTPDELDISQKTAIVFGAEFKGVSKQVKQQADDWLYIPMFGFTESLNLSVCAAIAIQRLVTRLHTLSGIDWHLSPDEKQVLRQKWTRDNIYRVDLIEKRFLEQQLNNQAP